MILTLTLKALDADVSPRDAAVRFASMFDMNLLTDSYMTAHESVETLARLMRAQQKLPMLLVRVSFEGSLHEVHECGSYHELEAVRDIGMYFTWQEYALRLAAFMAACPEANDDFE